MSEFTPNGCVVTPSLISALIKDNGRWAHAVLGQCFAMSPDTQAQLLSGAAKWTIERNTLTIIPAESQ